MKLVAALAALFVAFVFQAQLADRVATAQWRPDLLLAVVILAALLIRSRALALVALAGGLLEGVLCGNYHAAFVISRVLAALVAVVVTEPLEINLAVAVGTAAVAAGAAQIVFLLLEPASDLRWWASVAVRQTALVSLLVALLYPIARRLAGTPAPDEL